MNNLVTTIFLLLILSTGIYAQDDQYMELMKETIDMTDTANSIKDFQLAANQFERIADAFQNQWLPFYYSAYCYVQISHLEKSDELKDMNVDKAEELNKNADKLSPDNSEIYVMKGFILQARMDVEPMVRGFRYNDECLGFFLIAEKLDPENPRSYLWHGVNMFNTPSFWGGGKEKALPLLEKAIEKFATFKLQSPIHPNWGIEYTKKILLQCRE